MFASQTRVLIVDDMSAMRKIIRNILRDLGFTDLTEAEDGARAWELITSAEQPFGLIISDWNMPHCMGIDLLRRLRADARFKKTPFVMVTAESEQAQIVQAVKAGVDQYIVKPFSKETLISKLESVHQKVRGR